MSFKYNEVVPWGRNFDEYCRMFDLTFNELKLRILGCGDGPASFNSVCNKNGGNVISVDPIYSLSLEEIEERIHKTYDSVIEQTRNNIEKFRWNEISSVEELGFIRMNAMKDFLNSFENGKLNGKYISESLPNLSFNDNSFDISLSSHFLFLYSNNLSYRFHVESVREMLRVSNEVRIFPLLDVNAKKSNYVDRLIEDIDDFNIEIRKVNYEFQVGGNELMIISRKKIR